MTDNAISAVELPSGETVPALGQGTWGWAEDSSRRDDEISALRLGLDLGLTLVDTAEMYADGAAEELVGEAISGQRDQVFLVDKVLPSNATKQETLAACERSLKRLGTDWIDLYLLHWRGPTPLQETLEAFDELAGAGKIHQWGVSNFDVPDMQELAAVSGGSNIQTNQVLYNPTRRGIEYDLLPYCREHGVPVMAYAPIEQGRVLDNPGLREVANRHGATTAQVALAWVLRQQEVIAIPRAGTQEHVRDNRAALDLELTEEDLAAFDRAFPPPTGKQPLEIL